MSIDGFFPRQTAAFEAMSLASVDRFYRFVNALGVRLGVVVEGIEHLPPGRALLVANHTFGFDVTFPMGEIYKRTGRVVWALGEHAWWRFPLLRRLAVEVGTVDGTPENAARLLGADQLVLVLPGGLREAMKPHELRYRLLWGQRFGFVRAALASQAPIIPLAAVGADDLLDLVGNPFQRGRRWLGRFAFPLPRPRAGLPIVHKVQLRYVLGEPIPPRAGPERADDPEVLKQMRHEVGGAIEELIDAELARRAGFDE